MLLNQSVCITTLPQGLLKEKQLVPLVSGVDAATVDTFPDTCHDANKALWWVSGIGGEEGIHVHGFLVELSVKTCSIDSQSKVQKIHLMPFAADLCTIYTHRGLRPRRILRRGAPLSNLKPFVFKCRLFKHGRQSLQILLGEFVLGDMDGLALAFPLSEAPLGQPHTFSQLGRQLPPLLRGKKSHPNP